MAKRPGKVIQASKQEEIPPFKNIAEQYKQMKRTAIVDFINKQPFKMASQKMLCEKLGMCSGGAFTNVLKLMVAEGVLERFNCPCCETHEVFKVIA